MTTTVQTADIIKSGTGFSLVTGGDALFLMEGTIIASIDGTGIYGTAGNHTVYVYGSAYGNNTGAVFTNGGNALFVAETGSVTSGANSSGPVAVSMFGGNNTLTNHGIISGERTYGVAMYGDNASLINTGNITAKFGSIMWSSGASSGGRIWNSGQVLSTNVTGAAINFDHFASTTTDTVIHNSGVIKSLRAEAISGIYAELKIVNSGTIAGATYSYQAGDSDDIVINDGVMIGNVSLGDGSNTYTGRLGQVIGRIESGAGADTITGGALADTIIAGHGANEVRGLGGDDLIVTGDQADFIVAGTGDDDIESGNGDDEIRGGDGEDFINGQGGVDFIQGGNGNDYIRMGNGDGQRGEGNAGDDVLVGGNQRDVLLGGADEDELIGNNGNDVLRGGIGDDVLEGGNGDDRLIGNRGEDTAVFSGDSSDYTFTLNGNGTVDVFDTVGTDGTDNLFGVELVEFTDGTYLLIDLI